MKWEEIMVLTDEDLRIEVAELLGATDTHRARDGRLLGYWSEDDEGRGEGWQPIEDYPNDVAAAIGLAGTIADRFWLEIKTPFRKGDPFFAGFTPLGTTGWNGRPDYQGEAKTLARAIIYAFLLVKGGG